MAVSDTDVMAQLSGGASPPAGGASPAAPSAAPTPNSPAGAPMAAPEAKMGNREGALVNLGMAIDIIEQALPALGSESPEGKSALAAISALGKILGPRKAAANELQPAQIQQLIGALPQGAGAPPEMKAMGGGGGPQPAPAPAPGATPTPMAA